MAAKQMKSLGDELMNDHIDSRAALWASVRALMIFDFGEENQLKFSERTKIGLGTVGRIKQQTTSVGLEIVDRIAATYNLSGWQLLVPGFDPKNPPTLRMITDSERQMYDRLLAAARELAASEPLPAPYTPKQ